MPDDTHALKGGGWPHDHTGIPHLTELGPGHAVCTCGEVSISAGTATYRRVWFSSHRKHALSLEGRSRKDDQ